MDCTEKRENVGMTLRTFCALLLIALPTAAQSKSARDLGVGKILVASRDLADPNFKKTVILLAHYDADSILGLIINRRTDVPVARVFEKLKAAKGRTDDLYLGGPVDTASVLAMVQSPSKIEGASPVLDGVFLILTKGLLEHTMATGPDADSFHVYLGYAGWTDVQLRRELAMGSWFIFRADPEMVFDTDPETLWTRMIKKSESQIARR